MRTKCYLRCNSIREKRKHMSCKYTCGLWLMNQAGKIRFDKSHRSDSKAFGGEDKEWTRKLFSVVPFLPILFSAAPSSSSLLSVRRDFHHRLQKLLQQELFFCFQLERRRRRRRSIKIARPPSKTNTAVATAKKECKKFSSFSKKKRLQKYSIWNWGNLSSAWKEGDKSNLPATRDNFKALSSWRPFLCVNLKDWGIRRPRGTAKDSSKAKSATTTTESWTKWIEEKFEIII